MRKIYLVIGLIILVGLGSFSFTNKALPVFKTYNDSLRNLYSRPVAQWPRPVIDAGAIWSEMAVMPKDDTSWFKADKDPVTQLGKILFFDPRLSGSNQISCSSCHDPDLSWQDGRVLALGNDHLQADQIMHRSFV